MSNSISPAPTDEEAVAIAAAIEALWPRPVVAQADDGSTRRSSWRFSGRWWSPPVVSRRARPW
ncbi:MAG: hypothetical protein B7C54_00730 [Acidimicrobiales bacterium mtb01]|nr:hypothetical protein [Actinomycetota bacterium]TEX48306.1 MAG: hypothetical protein B7C54_00730 [Acidimicrobiales bacterium mtb01]